MKNKLISALTQLDAKEFARTKGKREKGYNPHALGIYFARVDDICADVQAGADLRAAIVAGFTGKCLVACLRALDLPNATNDERSGFGKPVCYTPIKAVENL